MLVTLTEIKEHLDLDTNDNDTILELYINAVAEYLEAKIGRVIEEETITEYLDGDDIKDTIFLANYPITTFTSIHYNTGTNASPVWTAFDEDDYQVDTAKGMILIDRMYSGRRNIKVVYKAGYAATSIPFTLKVAGLKLIAKIWNKRRSDGFSSEEAAGARVEWDKFMSADIEELINPHRKISI